jgi:hypothetical protein
MFLFLSGAQLFGGNHVGEVSAYPKKLGPVIPIGLPALPFHSATNPTHALIPNQPDFAWKSLRQLHGRAPHMDP